MISIMQTQNPVREDITELKEDVTTLTQELMVCTYMNMYTSQRQAFMSLWSIVSVQQNVMSRMLNYGCNHCDGTAEFMQNSKWSGQLGFRFTNFSVVHIECACSLWLDL